MMKKQQLEEYMAPCLKFMEFTGETVCSDSPYQGNVENIVNDEYVW